MKIEMKARVALACGLLSFALRASDCPEPPPGIRDILASSFYTDPTHSVEDEERVATFRAQYRPFEDYQKAIAKFTDAYLEKGKDLDCAVAWLERWAADGAMLGAMQYDGSTAQPQAVREWTLASIAISWDKIQARVPEEQRILINEWMRNLAYAGIKYKVQHLKNTEDNMHQNHMYWAGVSYLAVAIATGDKKLFKEAKGIYEGAIDYLKDDGSLPSEMKRGYKALRYHSFAEEPLLLMAEIARKSGENWFAYKNYKIDKLSRLVAAGLKDPAVFERMSGGYAPQRELRPNDLTWITIARARVPDGERFEGVNVSSKPQAYTGGKVSLLIEKGVFDPQ
jgi:poly(beta-D-mannuronate) lyase